MTVRVKFALTETVSPTRMIPRTERGFQVELPERHGELEVEGDLFAERRVLRWFLLPIGLLAGWGCAQKLPIDEGRMVDDPQEELSGHPRCRSARMPRCASVGSHPSFDTSSGPWNHTYKVWMKGRPG